MILRRRILQLGLAGAALLTCGGGLAWVTAGYRVPAGDTPVSLTVKELAVVRAIVEALLPGDGDLLAGLELGVHQRIDEEVWSQSADARSDLKAAVQVIEHLPVLFGHPGRLTRLSPAARLDVLAAMLRSAPTPLVQAVSGLRQLALMLYYADPRTWPAIGYDGPWVGTPVPPDSARAYATALAERNQRRTP